MAASPGSTGVGVQRGPSSQACKTRGGAGDLGHPSQACVLHLPWEGQVKCPSEPFGRSFQKVLWPSLEAP